MPTSPDTVITADRSEGDAVVVSQQISLLRDAHDAVPHEVRAVSTVAVASAVAKCRPPTVKLSDAENGRFGGSMSLTTGAANDKQVTQSDRRGSNQSCLDVSLISSPTPFRE